MSEGREPQLAGQTVVVIGGSAGIGLETARLARAEGADVILTARNPERLEQAADELRALSTAAFDATDQAASPGWPTTASITPTPTSRAIPTRRTSATATASRACFAASGIPTRAG